MTAAKHIWRSLSSYRTTLVLLLLYALVMAAATFVENRYGTPFVRRYFYGNLLFFLIQLLLVVNFIGAAIRGNFRKRKKWAMLTLHGSLVVILAGALITHCFGVEGRVHIREGETQSQMVLSGAGNPHSAETAQLPFEIGLTDFRLLRYPGSHAPSSYESDLVIHSGGQAREVMIYMNRVVRQDGYRLYQASYDTDEKGTVLSINRDPWGMAVTYCGYGLLLLGILMMLFGRNTRFRQLAQSLGKGAGAVIAVWFLSTASAYATPMAGLPGYIPGKEHVEKFGRLLVQNLSGRIGPVDTYSAQVLRKIHRSNTFEGYSSDQVLLGIVTFPEFWSNVPLLRQKNSQIKALIDNDAKYVSFNDLFDETGQYRLFDRVERIYAKPIDQRDNLEKEIVKLDDKANLLYELLQGHALALFPLPGDPAHKWYSAGDDLSAFTDMDSMFVNHVPEGWLAGVREGDYAAADKMLDMISKYQRSKAGIELPDEKMVSLEIIYNKLDLFNRLFKLYLILGAVLLAVGITNMVRSLRRFPIVRNTLAALIALCFLLHAFYFVLRWYISGQPPWSNAYESMVYVGWVAVLAGLIFVRRAPVATAMATMLGGIILFVAHLNWMDPEITPLVPVLKSPWLMIHVSVIMAGYGFLGMSFLLGIFHIASACFMKPGRRPVGELTVINELSMTIGVALLTAGIFLGAVWANESWGRYWGWDPKETWALITMVAYAIVLHMRLVPALNSPLVFNLGSVYAFLTVLMTYFGVNYFLGGLHSYGNTDTPSAIWIVAVLYIIIFLLSVYASWRGEKNEKTEETTTE